MQFFPLDPALFESLLGAADAPAGFVLGFVAMLLVGLAANARARRRLRRIAEAREAVQVFAGYGVVVVGAKGEVLDANPAARDLLWREAKRGELQVLPEAIRPLLSEAGEQRHVLRVGKGQQLDLLI